MGALASLLSSSSLYLFLLFTLELRFFCAASTCRPSSCSIGTEIRFPFRLNTASTRCGYPGFNLSCSDGFPIIDLPFSGEFTVEGIDYASQTISLSDPDQCLHRRFLNFNLSGSPFQAVDSHRFTFYNCSSLKSDSASVQKIPCLSGPNFTVVAVAYGDESPPDDSCRYISTVSIPVRLLILQYGSFVFTHEDLILTWNKPDCGLCEAIDRGCGYKDGSNSMEVICSHSETHPQGLSMGAKYGLIIGAGVPGMVLLIGIIGCTFKRMKRFSRREEERNPHNSNLEMGAVPPHIVVVNGLDKPTIESFPKTVLGESGRLPNPNDMTCPICLSEYQPKDTLRTIPQCKHYFHADCVDEWLKMNATCPLCRNTPDAISTTTPSSSMPSSSSSS